MLYLLWFSPAIVLALAVMSRRCTPVVASLLGLATAIPVAFAAAPSPFGFPMLASALARGAWIGATIAPYILGGLLFWQVASRASPAAIENPGPPAAERRARRRLLFFACFLVGPFAESATGFGVGMLGTIALLRPMRLQPVQLMLFALLSQTFIPWGAMGSGTLLAAAYAKMPPAELGVASLLPIASLMVVWLTLFWLTARKAGVSATASDYLSEVCWVIVSLAVLGVATVFLGPEVAMLAAFGPLIVARHLLDTRPSATECRQVLGRVWPYLILVGVLTLTRAVPPLRAVLVSVGTIAPYPDLPGWAPFLHAGSWLIGGAVLVALLRGQFEQLRAELRGTWKTARTPVVTVFMFAMLAEVLAAAGISKAIAAGTYEGFGALGILAAPMLSVGLGMLTNSGSAANSLFMSSQVAMSAQAQLSVPFTAALQHVSASSMSLFSPVRMAIAASLAEGQGKERQVYAALVPYALACVAILACLGVWAVF
jgi:lactate permease